jgi:hypothetical protein
MPQSIVLFVGALVVLFLVVTLAVPAGYGLPSPVWGIIAMVAIAPGLFVGWLLYRRHVARGDVEPLGAGGPDPERDRVAMPNRDQAVEQVNSFRRAAGDDELEEAGGGYRTRSPQG